MSALFAHLGAIAQQCSCEWAVERLPGVGQRIASASVQEVTAGAEELYLHAVVRHQSAHYCVSCGLAAEQGPLAGYNAQKDAIDRHTPKSTHQSWL